MPQALNQEVSTSRPPAGSRILQRSWAHGARDTKATSKWTITTELHANLSFVSLYTVQANGIKGSRVVSGYLLTIQKMSSKSSSMIICLIWLCMQLTAVSQFREVFKSPLAPGKLFVLGGERCIWHLLLLPLLLIVFLFCFFLLSLSVIPFYSLSKLAFPASA